MSGTYLVLPTLLTILVSVLAVRAGAIALTMTGMHYSQARFQALSAFSGTGFTTHAAESVVNHPARRRIVSWLMLLGNAGIVVVIVTATSSFVNTNVGSVSLNVGLLMLGVAVIYVVATRTGLARRWELFVERRLARSAVFDDEPAEELLHIAEGYGLMTVTFSESVSHADRTSSTEVLALAGYPVVGIDRAGKWLATPTLDEKLIPGDRVVVYGRLQDMKKTLESE